MKKLFLIFISMFTFAFCTIDSVFAIDYPFSLTTTNQTSSSWNFRFQISGTGTFYVDCGTNGTLSRVSGGSATVSGTTITKTADTSITTFKCQYTSSGSKTIRFGGTATAYYKNGTSSQVPAIRFYTTAANSAMVASISGNLSTIFPDLGSGDGQSPMFHNTFYQCINLQEIPDTLFSGYTSGRYRMFYRTFYGCTSLTSIPVDLFKNITTSANYTFSNTFQNCTGLTSIPALFQNITTVSGQSVFYYTFSGCTGLTSISADLFKNITTGQNYTFQSTFSGCTGLTSIPSDLFKNITTGTPGMFSSTFNGCTGLTSIPADLFKNITNAYQSMFYRTFYGCTNLTGTVPWTLFSGLIANGSPTATDMMKDIFSGTGLSTTCPSNKKQYVTGYESNWATGNGNAVVCGEPITCSSGYYLPRKTTTCSSSCPTNYTCIGGTFGFDAKNNQGTTPNIYTVTLRNYNNTATHGTIYYKYGSGWYSDSAATNKITSVTVPTRSGYAFRGFYTAIQSDLTANGGTSLIPTVFNTGSVLASFGVTANTNLYAGWAKNCAPGTGCTCNMNVSSSGSITYTTTPNTGYTITSGMGAYNPVCTKNTINMTFDGVATTPSQCTYGNTFSTPPMPSPRAGQVFTGWKVKTITKPYTQLEYLQSDGNQYIDTNTVADLNTKAEIKFMHTQFDSSSVYYGVFGTAFLNYSAFSLSTRYTQDFYVKRYISNFSAISPLPALNTDYVVEMSIDRFVINGVTTTSASSTEFTSDSIYLFRVNSLNNHLPLIGKIYYFKLYENGTLVHNFVPARRNSDSVLGMYDTVSDVFLTNSGTGTFTAGPNVGQVGN